MIYAYEAQKRTTVKFYDTANDVVYHGAIQSITRSSSTATVTKKNHGFTNGKTLTIAGADQSEYNGSVTVGDATADTFTYSVSGTPVTPATGDLELIDTEQSLWVTLPEVVHPVSIGAATTVKLEASIDLSLGWVQVGSDLTSADNGIYLVLSAKYNFVRLRRSSGTGAVLAHAQY